MKLAPSDQHSQEDPANAMVRIMLPLTLNDHDVQDHASGHHICYLLFRPCKRGYHTIENRVLSTQNARLTFFLQASWH
jgi:hypothetical protein